MNILSHEYFITQHPQYNYLFFDIDLLDQNLNIYATTLTQHQYNINTTQIQHERN